jgi:IS1 family transposase
MVLTKLVRSRILNSMNRLEISQQMQIVSAFVEGNGVRATSGMTGCSPVTVLKLLNDLGCACAGYHNRTVRNLKVRRLQCDEIWCFEGAKAKNTTPEQEGWGDVWTWVGIDADTKLVVSYLVGGRDGGWAKDFIEDCAKRISNRVRITTDGHKPYLEAAEEAFVAEIDYAMLQKIYGAPSDEETRRYSPAKCIGCDLNVVSGHPDPKHVSTSFVERQNLPMPVHMRRFTRLANGHSKKIDNHHHAVALHYMFYNFCKIDQTLRVTPAMDAGLTDHVWSLQELVGLIRLQQ